MACYATGLCHSMLMRKDFDFKTNGYVILQLELSTIFQINDRNTAEFRRHQDPPSVRHNDFLKPMIKFSEICKRPLCMAIFTNENH